MTLLNYFAREDRAFLIQDTAVFGDDGRIVEFLGKARPCASIRGAIGGAGQARILETFQRYIERHFVSIDDLIETGREFMEGLSNIMRRDEDARGRSRSNWSILAAGWSELTGAPRSVLIAHTFKAEHGFWPDVKDVFTPEIERPEMMDYFASFMLAGGRKAYDPARHALPLVEKQRRIPVSAWKGGVPSFGIGGAVQVTVIGRAGVSQQIIHQWPEDEIGKRIAPQPIEPGRPMNRQQRRAMRRTG